jgi:hypothetical protein
VEMPIVGVQSAEGHAGRGTEQPGAGHRGIAWGQAGPVLPNVEIDLQLHRRTFHLAANVPHGVEVIHER